MSWLLFFPTPIVIYCLLICLVLQSTNAFDIEYRLTTTCNVEVSLDNINDKRAYERCSKQSANRFLKLLTPDPEWRFEHVDDISTTLDGDTRIVISAFDLFKPPHDPNIVDSTGGLYFTANYYNEDPIPDTFRRGLRAQSSKGKNKKGKNKKDKQYGGKESIGTGTVGIESEDGAEDVGNIAGAGRPNPADSPEEVRDGFENAFRVQYRNRLIKCLEHKSFFDEPQVLDDYICSGSMETIITP